MVDLLQQFEPNLILLDPVCWILLLRVLLDKVSLALPYVLRALVLSG
jgi:hypothetical protein